ncbi:DUF6640 family protein [Pleurocapsa sp. PCC 7319]|uniref:DUF6640 family protein n=1 Tax=Pleurocapsa sp. PCC 7319 TaxID=118161 RepID=UPI00034CC67F|nr:DUF6640 family protein [Pleurocapsa sp. PCC 7319]
MSKANIGKFLLSIVLVSGALISIIVDWNESHVFNPEWTSHARFHDVVLLCMLTGMSIVGLWLIWRRSLEPNISFMVAAAVPILFWGSFFIAVFVPGSSLSVSPEETPPSLAGIPLYPNIILAGINVILSLVSYKLYRSDKVTSK